MKTLLILSVLLSGLLAATAAAVGAAEAAPEEQPENIQGLVSEDAAAPETRFNVCPSSWFPFNSRCFKFVSTPMSWYDAEEYCNSMGAHLASVRSAREYRFLQQITETSLTWLGGFNLQGRWMWIDGQGFYFTTSPSMSSSSSFPCIYLHSSSNWWNTGCGHSFPFICSLNPFSC